MHLTPLICDLIVESIKPKLHPSYVLVVHSFATPESGRDIHLHGPAIEVDWLEGKPVTDKVLVTVISVCESSCTMSIYNIYDQMLRKFDSGYIVFAHDNPAFPDNVVKLALALVEHHELLRCTAQDEYDSFVLEKQRKGKTITIDDIPNDRHPVSTRRDMEMHEAAHNDEDWP